MAPSERRWDVLTADGVLDAASPEGHLLRQLRGEERRQIVTEAIEGLHDQDRDVLYHRYVHKMPHKVIARLMGLELEQVRARLIRGGPHLEKELGLKLQGLSR
jgi:RNA polymerase sigma factor (sigma-70 family)